ncbi:adenylyl-sulfate kinase, partial [Pelomicrobium sp. G1]
ERLDPARDLGPQPVRFFVQLVGRPRQPGQGRRLMGRVESGAGAPGMEVWIYPGARSAQVRTVLCLDGPVERAQAGDAVT